ncbi:uncharacterized protein LOC142817328 [Rhipicephalus microplus]|uniref:uncharacterized protein LOC142817328 n=1 Tax=Rhipicephalus microplus TaxID=6941 RepID=UPI003F6CB327
MTSFPISGVQKTGKKVFIRRGEPDTSSTVSSITDTSSSVADGKWKTVVNRQAGLATKINLCTMGNAAPNTNFASWNFDPDAEKAKKKKKKKKERRDKKKKREEDAERKTGFLSAELARMDTTAMLKTTPNEASAASTATQTTPSSMTPLFRSPSSVDHSGLHGAPLDSSESTDSGVPCIQGLLIGILLLSVIGIIIVAYFAVVRYTTEENPDRETQMMKDPEARAIQRTATQTYHLRHRRNGMKT